MRRSQIVVADLDLHLVRLGQHRDRAAEVWMRPCVSVSGTRWTRWPPLSNCRCRNTPSPLTLNDDFLEAAELAGTLIESPRPSSPAPRRSAGTSRSRSPANRAASSPPVPARISTMQPSRAAVASWSSASISWSASSCAFASSCGSSAEAISASSRSEPGAVIDLLSSICCSSFRVVLVTADGAQQHAQLFLQGAELGPRRRGRLADLRRQLVGAGHHAVEPRLDARAQEAHRGTARGWSGQALIRAA